MSYPRGSRVISWLAFFTCIAAAPLLVLSGYSQTPFKEGLRITASASRDEPGAGSDFGINADIENISDKPVYLNPKGFTMTAPPELDPDGPREWFGFFTGPVNTDSNNNELDRWDRVIVLEPHSTITAFWSGNVQPFYDNTPLTRTGRVCNSIFGGGGGCYDHWKTMLRGLTFPPGKYKITIVGTYWDDYQAAKDKTAQRHTVSQSLIVPLAASQTTVIIGAILGGVIAFFLLEFLFNRNAETKVSKFKGSLLGFTSSILTSTVMTILLARLAQTQFIIKVSVNDFWGAIAIGFVAAAAGPTIVQKLTNALLAPAPSTNKPASDQTEDSKKPPAPAIPTKPLKPAVEAIAATPDTPQLAP